MVRSAIRDLELPDEQAAEQAADAVDALTLFLRAHPTPSTHVQLVPEDTDAVTTILVPSVAFRFFVDVLAELANGNAVTVAPVHAELTSQQAADLLNVSRPFLIKLLDEERIPHRKVGKHRRIRMEDVMAYKTSIDAERESVLDQLTAEAQEHGMGYKHR